MTTELLDTQRITEALYQTNDRQSVLQTLAGFEANLRKRQKPSASAHQVRFAAFEVLQALTATDAEAARPVILEQVLPMCLARTDRDEDEDSVYAAHRYREYLRAWIDQYPPPQQTALRDAVLEALQAALAAEQPENACYTVVAIGFRSDVVSECLWDIVRRDTGPIGDLALSVLLWLGVLPDEREAVRVALHQRMSDRLSSTLISAAATFADATSIEVIDRNWLQSPRSADDEEASARALIPQLLASIADAHDDDGTLQDRVWALIGELAHEESASFAPDIALNGSLASHCDSPHVVPFLLAELSADADETDAAIHRRYLLTLRLSECVRPRQLFGWVGQREQSSRQVLIADATRDSGVLARLLPIEGNLKEEAWKTLLCLEDSEVLCWFESAIGGETNPFVRTKLCELLSCFRLDSLPHQAHTWITEPYALRRDAPEPLRSQVPFRSAAIDLAHSVDSYEAFEALVSCGFSLGGETSRQVVDALSEVAVHLAKSGDSRIAPTLLRATTESPEIYQRQAAAIALAYLALEHLLPQAYSEALTRLVENEAREPYERGVLLVGLNAMESPGTSTIDEECLARWAAERDDWLGWRALEVLAMRGHLTSYPELVQQRLGLVCEGDSWVLISPHTRTHWAGNLLGLLYSQYAKQLAPILSSFLQSEPYEQVAQLITQLRETHASGQTSALDRQVIKGLIARLRAQHTGQMGEIALFADTAVLCADQFAEEQWETLWDGWLPQARAALADALADAEYTAPEALARARALLEALTKDAQYAVRRSAYRGLSRHAPALLEIFCKAGVSTSPLDVRQRAAEACGWFGNDETQHTLFAQIYELLRADREEPVRVVATRAAAERRERLWAAQYLEHVLAVRGTTNADTLATWRYGQALGRLGDDQSLKSLRTHLAQVPLPPHVRYWIRRLLKNIEERWRKVVRDWPEPWYTFEGKLNLGTGALLDESGQSQAVQYMLWSQPAPDPMHEHGSWGGVMMSSSRFRNQRATLMLRDGLHRLVWVTENTTGMNNVAHFRGSDAYPL